MRTYIDCIPCFLRQALDAVRMATDDENIQEEVLRDVLRASGEMEMSQSPPAMGQYIHRLIRRLAKNNDPYLEAKAYFNRLALDAFEDLKAHVEASDDPMNAALRLAIAGNVIDLGAKTEIGHSDVAAAVEYALTAPFEGEVEAFYDAVSQAEEVLYLADNAGEIVFDRLLVEEVLSQFPETKITVAVRGFPIINDATMEDAEATGMTDLAPVIDNGSDAPGTILETCSREFRRRFEAADIVIAKGQGNYETLSEVEKDIFFLLKVKCPVIARDIDSPLGSAVLKRSRKDGSRGGDDREFSGVSSASA